MNQTDNEVSFQDGQIIWNYIFLSILFIAVLSNNSLVLTAVWSQKRLQSQVNVVILASMAVAQLVGGLLGVPINMALVQDYDEDSRLKFSVVVTTFSGVATQLHLSLLCVERYVVVVNSIAHGNLNRGSVLVAIIIAWLFSILAALLSLVDFKNYSVFLVTVFFILPSLVDILGYAFLYRSSKGLNQTTLLRKELRLAKWFSIFTLIFNVFWFPFIVTILLRDHCGSCDTEKGSLFLFILYFQLLSLTMSAVIYYRASLDFRLAFKIVASELCSIIGTNTDSEHPQDVVVNDATMSRDGNGNHVNAAMFWNGESNRNARLSAPSLRHSQSDNSAAKTEHEEVHIVPFDQTKYFSEKKADEHFPDENEVYGGMSLDDEFGFNDIDIVPYDQSC